MIPNHKNLILRLVPAFALFGVLSLTPVARAEVPGGLGAWEGTGHTFDASGADLGEFTISLVRKQTAPGHVRADGKVRLANGREIPFFQEYEDRGPRGFSLVTSSGTGGGRCFSNGMCTAYEAKDGHAFATSIAVDGSDKLRVLVTELENGQAVRFFHQTLTKRA